MGHNICHFYFFEREYLGKDPVSQPKLVTEQDIATHIVATKRKH